MQKITPFLWYDGQAEEAARFYIALFPNSRILNVTRYSEAGPGPAGSVLTVAFQLNGQEFVALNGGPLFKFTEAVSFVINCETQQEMDKYWEALTANGGEESKCGWLKDKYGLSWQIFPVALGKMLSDPDPNKVKRVHDALLQMRKLDLSILQRAYDEA
jgi:predicted 3-demethylubiquinone-9 3-methyltransferase (glyoxalase superfamily)